MATDRPGTTTSAPDPASASGDRLSAHLFFLLFVAQILSPTYFGVTIYLEVLVALVTPGYWRWFASLRSSGGAAVSFLLLCASLAVARPAGMAEVVALTVTVLYLVYTYERGNFLLFRYLGLSIALAIIQSTLLQLGSPLAFDLGPQNISTTVWGSHATATRTNFYSILGGVDRVSGLSREAGFFASLIVVSAVVFWLGPRRPSRLKFGALALGWVLSLSKMSLLVLPIFLLLMVRRWLDQIPGWLAVLGFAAVCAVGANSFAPFLLEPENESFFHRFGGYLAIDAMTLMQVLGGAELTELHAPEARLLAALFTQPAGLSGFFITNGVVVVLLVFMTIVSLGGRATAMLLICMGSINVDPLSSQNFVALTYFAALYLLPRHTLGLTTGTPGEPTGSAKWDADISHRSHRRPRHGVRWS